MTDILLDVQDDTPDAAPPAAVAPPTAAAPPATVAVEAPSADKPDVNVEGTPEVGSTQTGVQTAVQDWASLREKYAKGDEKVLKRLARYSSHESVLDALLAAQNRIASGALKPVLPEKASPEELAAWRESNGIPDSPAGYEVKLPDDVELTPEDEAQLSDILTAAHENNMTPVQVNAILGKMLAQQQAATEAQLAADHNFKLESHELLRDEWGSEFKTNINVINGLLNNAPEGTRELLLGARLADGTVLGNHPQVLRWLANTARELNPLATVVPATTANAPLAVDAELNSIRSLMGDQDSKYWKGPEAKTIQARYRQLLEAKTRHGSRQ